MNLTKLHLAVIAVAVFAGGIFVGVLLSVGASDGAPTAQSTPPPDASRTETAHGNAIPTIKPPPKAVLRTAGGREVTGGAGTRCWDGMCLDMVGPVSNPDAFTLKATEDFTVSYEAGSPTAVYEAWRGASGPGELTASGERLWKDIVPGVAMARAGGPRPPLQPGRYLYMVFAQWQGKGDISYAWYIEVP